MTFPTVCFLVSLSQKAGWIFEALDLTFFVAKDCGAQAVPQSTSTGISWEKGESVKK